MSEKWLRCLIQKGMFSDEVVAQYGDASFFVPKSQVVRDAGDSQSGKLRVKSFARDSNWFAVLPTEYQDVISVSESDLAAA